ncbi:MAG: ribonuclease R [Flavobacteriaceae bacterium]
MAKKQRGAGDDNLPSREQIIEFLESAPGNAGKREIARAFGVKGSARIALKALLREMKAEGLIEKRGSHLHKPGELPPVTVLEIVRRDTDGDLVGIPNDWDESHGRPPELIVTQARNARESAPGIGDLVLARIAEGGRAPDAAHVARIIKVISRKPATAIGIFRGLPGGGGRVEPVDKRQLKSFAIAPNARNGAEEGDLVTIEPVRGRPMGLPQAKVKTVLAEQSTEYALSEIAIHRHDIPHVFPEAVLREAKEAKPAGNDHREDLTALPLVTIDPADAKDHDDAVYAEADPEHEGGFVLWVAIADVSWYVRPGDAMDREARKRGNSVYFPDRVVPMLPERISNDLCSLREKELRPALVARIRIDGAGRKHGHTFIRANIRSAAKLAYPQAQAAIDGRPDEKTEPLLETVLKPLWKAYEVLARARDNRGPLALDLPERKILLKPDGHVERVFIPPRLDAHRLIEEFMIIANVAAAETLEKRKAPGLYRVHDQPSDVKIASLSDFLSSIGEKLPKDGVLRPSHFNAILSRIKGSPNETLVNEVILRSQAQAEYSAQNYGHFGLNLRSYAHFTSPIRRYADLVVHRSLIETLGLGPGGQVVEDATELDEIAAETSSAERRAMAAERETVDRLIAHFVSESVGATFAATISGVTRSGLFIRLDESGADGFVPASTIGGDYWVHDDVHQRLVGERTRGVYQLGDRVEAKLVEAVPMAGALRFELLTPARQDKGVRPPARRRAGPGRKPSGRPARAKGKR